MAVILPCSSNYYSLKGHWSKDASWPLKEYGGKDACWSLKGYGGKDVSWPLKEYGDKDASWPLKGYRGKEASWPLKGYGGKDTSWPLKGYGGKDASWPENEENVQVVFPSANSDLVNYQYLFKISTFLRLIWAARGAAMLVCSLLMKSRKSWLLTYDIFATHFNHAPDITNTDCWHKMAVPRVIFTTFYPQFSF